MRVAVIREKKTRRETCCFRRDLTEVGKVQSQLGCSTRTIDPDGLNIRQQTHLIVSFYYDISLFYLTICLSLIYTVH